MAFRRDPTVTIVDKMEYLKTNANGAGISIYQQAQSVLESVLEVAREGLYVDYSADMKGAIILNYRAEDIINWRTERINGRDKLVLVVLRECVEEPDGYGFKDRINTVNWLWMAVGSYVASGVMSGRKERRICR